MEEDLSLFAQIRQTFGLKEVDVRTYSPLTLAYIGDAVYDVIIRTAVVERGNRAVNELHRMTSRLVKATAQAALIGTIEELLSEEEEAVYKRGRNAKSHTVAKNASVEDYRKATGLEALVGYLYLQERTERILELVKEGLDRMNMAL